MFCALRREIVYTKNMNFLYFLFALLVGFLTGSSMSKANVLKQGSLLKTDTLMVAELPLPEIPKTLRTVPERAAYVLEHFWDELDFNDTLRSRHRVFMEQNFVNFVSLFPHALQENRARAVKRLMKAAETDSVVYSLLTDMAEKYLYEPESPMVCEDCFLFFLEEIVHSSVLNGYTQMRMAYLLESVKKTVRASELQISLIFCLKVGDIRFMKLRANIFYLFFTIPVVTIVIV